MTVKCILGFHDWRRLTAVEDANVLEQCNFCRKKRYSYNPLGIDYGEHFVRCGQCGSKISRSEAE